MKEAQYSHLLSRSRLSGQLCNLSLGLSLDKPSPDSPPLRNETDFRDINTLAGQFLVFLMPKPLPLCLVFRMKTGFVKEHVLLLGDDWEEGELPEGEEPSFDKHVKDMDIFPGSVIVLEG